MRFFAFIPLLMGLSAVVSAQIPGPIVWPTPNTAFMEGKDVSTFIQPTVSGRVSSGLYGCVRNSGYRFHEGMDLFPIFRTPDGEADEPIYAIMKGVVVCANSVASRSGYGKYVVIEHPEADLDVYTLYAHLASVDPAMVVGAEVEAGTVVGQHGRSANSVIPKSRAHLHFEIGVRLSDGFDGWYKEQDYENPNYFGIWNGMNLSGVDPLAFYMDVRSNRFTTFQDYFSKLTRAVTVRVHTSKIPDYAQRYPELLGRPLDLESTVVAWDVTFTQYGTPIELKPWYREDLEPAAAGAIQLISMDKDLVAKTKCWRTFVVKGSSYQVGRFMDRTLKLLFEF